MCNGRARETTFYKIFHTALLVGLVGLSDPFNLTTGQRITGQISNALQEPASLLCSHPMIFQETGATYQYQIGGSEELHLFVANPNKGAKARMTFAAYGDMGETKRRARKNPMYECHQPVVIPISFLCVNVSTVVIVCRNPREPS